MKSFHDEISRITTEGVDIFDITEDVASRVQKTGIRDGIALVFVPGSTAAITTLEFESGAVEDLKRAIAQIAPPDGDYSHNKRWNDGNGYAHVSAALLGPSQTFPVISGGLAIGNWQQIVLVDFDNKPRKRAVIIQVMGK